MSCYLDELPKDIRTLLDHYTLRENWNDLYTILKASARMLFLIERESVNACMTRFHLRTYFTYGADPHTEDLITDGILNSVIQSIVATCHLDSCLMLAVGEINGNLEQAGSRLRLVITLNDSVYRTKVIRGHELLS